MQSTRAGESETKAMWCWRESDQRGLTSPAVIGMPYCFVFFSWEHSGDIEVCLLYALLS